MLNHTGNSTDVVLAHDLTQIYIYIYALSLTDKGTLKEDVILHYYQQTVPPRERSGRKGRDSILLPVSDIMEPRQLISSGQY